MKLFPIILTVFMAFSLPAAQLVVPFPPCPQCNPLAGCPIPRCPCVHDGFYVYPGNHPLNPPRPSWCPPCDSNCPNISMRCNVYLRCTADQVATYKCIKKIGEDEMLL